MNDFIHRTRAIFAFYRRALTKYQLHSPFVFGLADAVLEDRRLFYAYRDVEAVRDAMRKRQTVLSVEDFGTGAGDQTKVVQEKTLGWLVRRSASSPEQGRRLFRLANWAKPTTILELGTATGISAMYLASAAREATFISLEGSAALAGVARENLALLGLKNTTVLSGEFGETLPQALSSLSSLDFVYFDGNHRPIPTLQYFEQCLPFAHDQTVFVFDDIHWSPGMTEAWRQLQAHPRTTLTVDLYDLALVFINPDFKEKQHLSVVPSKWKPWKIF